MELLGGQNRFPRSHLSEFLDVPAGCQRGVLDSVKFDCLYRAGVNASIVML